MGTDLIEILIEDIIEAVDSKRPLYIGTMIVLKREDELRIVDGQQRLLTLLMLLREIYSATDSTKIKDEIDHLLCRIKHQAPSGDGAADEGPRISVYRR